MNYTIDINSLFKDATQLHVNGDFSNAEALYKKILTINRRNFETIHRLAILYSQNNQFDLAIEYFKKALSINPLSSEALFNRANLFIESKLPKDALVDIDKALLITKNNPFLHLIQGNANKLLKNYDDAINSYSQAISYNPNFFEAYCNRGVVYKELKKYDNAIKDFSTSILINNNLYDAYNNRAAVYIELKKFDDALSDINNSLKIRPNFDDALYNLSTIFKNQKQLENAVITLKKVLDANPTHIESLIHLAVLLQELGKFDEAYNYFLKALEIEPEFRFNRSTFLTLKNKLCIWDNFDDEINCVISEISDTSKIATPFHLLGLIDRPDLHLISTINYVKKEFPEDDTLGLICDNSISGKIRLGYYSADFHNHATSYLMAELFELHDKSKFELFAFSFGPKRHDEMYIRVSKSFDHFFEVNEMSDKDIAILSRNLNLDIAIDLKGYTQDARPNIFANKCAPIQVNYLGYPGTLGADYYDYIIADKVVIPEKNKHFYTEKIAYLPNCYQPNDSKRVISDRIFTKTDFDLPEKGFVFCCFNNCYKILPNIFDIWMEILISVEGSVLWLLDDNPTATSNLLKEACKRGLDKHRLVFAKRMKLDEHLARHKFADLFLDTLPYNAHTTASDALWTGLPVLTCSGQSFASRVGASLLHSLDLPELITNSILEYKARAIEYGNNPKLINNLKIKLRNNLETESLFNSKLFTKDIEQVYVDMRNNEFK